MTPVEGEVIADLTNDRLRLGDGILAGGHLQASAKDVQNNTFVAGSAGGTANALTLTLSPAPTSYVTNMAVTFRATAANTGGATLNVNGLGAINLRKVSSGSIVALASGDIANGAYYTAIYDGTNFIITNISSGGVTSVSGTGGIISSGGSTPSISIDTNNALGVGSIGIFQSVSVAVAAGATVGGASLRGISDWQTTGAFAFSTTPSGTWRNITGSLINIGRVGLFIRVS